MNVFMNGSKSVGFAMVDIINNLCVNVERWRDLIRL